MSVSVQVQCFWVLEIADRSPAIADTFAQFPTTSPNLNGVHSYLSRAEIKNSILVWSGAILRHSIQRVLRYVDNTEVSQKSSRWFVSEMYISDEVTRNSQLADTEETNYKNSCRNLVS